MLARRLFRSVIGFAAIPSLAACVMVDSGQVFRPNDLSGLERPALAIWNGQEFRDSDAGLRHEVLEMGGERIAVSTAPSETGPLWLYCGGTAFDRVADGYRVLARLNAWGEAVVWDYPGYGDSTGVPSLQSVGAVAGEMARWADARASGRGLILWGHSLGGTVCAEVAARSAAADGLVLAAAFGEPRAAARAAARSLAGGLPVRLRFADGIGEADTVTMLAGTDMPVLVLGAEADEVVPVELQRELATRLETTGHRVHYAEFAGRGHNGLLGDAEVMAVVGDWLALVGDD